MRKYIISISAILLFSLCTYAQKPLYIVNGVETDDIRNISPDDIEHIDQLPADDQTVAKYGIRANNGVMIVTLRYDSPAVFEANGLSFDEYISSHVTWGDNEPAARIILRYKITHTGSAVLDKELESTDKRLRRKVLKALSNAPLWQPASKKGTPVESERILHIQLPEGKILPKPLEVTYR